MQKLLEIPQVPRLPGKNTPPQEWEESSKAGIFGEILMKFHWITLKC